MPSLSLASSLWRSVGRFIRIKDIGAVECVAKQCRDSLNGDFWRGVWVNRCQGRIFKSKRRKYKIDVLVYYSKRVVSNMRFCTSVNCWYENWQEAVERRRDMLMRENKHLDICIRSYAQLMSDNKRKLGAISRVEKQVQSTLHTLRTYPSAEVTGPMLTQKRRIEEELTATKHNPWQHYQG